ncbi:MAG: recombinase A [Planctomycetes bacterium]|nr:recombinase A [Planctomycetota bacterium]
MAAKSSLVFADPRLARLVPRIGSLRIATSIRPFERPAAGRTADDLAVEYLAVGDLAGRLVELVGSRLSVAVDLLRQAQHRGEPVAWVHSTAPPPYPPDLASRAVDLRALAVVRVDDDRAMLRAADQLLRSGAFGLVALDFLTRPRAPLAAQVRLAGLCRQHHCTLLCLAPESAFPMASLRADIVRARQAGRFVCTVRVDKDKQRGTAWRTEQRFDGPVGMR